MTPKTLVRRPLYCLAVGALFVALGGMAGCPETFSCGGDLLCHDKSSSEYETDGYEPDGGGDGGGGGY